MMGRLYSRSIIGSYIGAEGIATCGSYWMSRRPYKGFTGADQTTPRLDYDQVDLLQEVGTRLRIEGQIVMYTTWESRC
jgi:hypothetical protein